MANCSVTNRRLSEDDASEVRSTVCTHCGTTVCYLADPRTLMLKKKTA